ncbi:DUF4123 domain-containing protein [Stutzerimonas zhaodongensis]|uniref:DUF4123 domain-containing protein n=1 Tax=Stutzerimonas zhaodongensis TaxID=1176257 RepID=A0A3M2HZP6_9GAMM|nr:DUF4123 domain-containing protein [Stutzerimonas zhaodongensis]MCQ2028246.1 DUF4123 domain-containing protein [Stutzerimonas zhaodongensis]MCQ4315531.1 DUF4123 domain-containing protein [Stutzerimonas zhaodongensis]RMH91597.1 DUF4123 domain-containing protein [Stutzerimonas zhaodongensis]
MNAGHWLLLERTEHLLPKLYHLGEDPSPIRLFDDTELAACEEESPLLINARANPSLLAAVQNEPHSWPGLVLETTGTTQDLLVHLRHILVIRFDQERRGVLRYSRPRTASYFFPASDTVIRPLWLGPIQRLSWYGGTWHERADGREAWQQIDNRQAQMWRPATTDHELHLSATQERALQRQQSEHFLYLWWERQSGIRFETAWTYLSDGMQTGFVAADSLSAYLDLRHANPHATPPGALSPGTDQEPLDALAVHLSNNTTDKESSV